MREEEPLFRLPQQEASVHFRHPLRPQQHLCKLKITRL